MKTKASDKSIIDWLNFDLTNFFLQEYQEVNSEEIQGLYCIDYEKELPDPEFEIFDTMRLRVFSRTREIESCEHVNVTFSARNNEWDVSKLDNLINILYDIYGKDHNKKKKLTSEDISDLHLNIFDRVWTLGSDDNIYSVQVTKTNRDGLELHIIFLKNLLHCIGKL